MTGPHPVVLVAGLGRCGTSLTMQMLAAAGIPCVGTHPDYEVPDLDHCAIDATWFEAQRGKAAKLLDPHQCQLPVAAFVIVIWLDRDPQQQALSQIKLLGSAFPSITASMARKDRQRWAASMRRDRTAALRSLARRPIAMFKFEDLIEQPLFTAREIDLALQPWFGPLDTAAMAGVVIPRPPTCAPDLTIEEFLCAQAEARP